MPLHSSLGNKSETPSQKKKKKRELVHLYFISLQRVEVKDVSTVLLKHPHGCIVGPVCLQDSWLRPMPMEGKPLSAPGSQKAHSAGWDT